MNTDSIHTPENTNDGLGRLNKRSYRDGYLHTRDLEPHMQEDNRSVRQNIRKHNSAAPAWVLGIKLGVIAALVGGTFFLLGQQYRQAATPGQIAPATNSSQP
jgi:hypothetical protein